MAFRYSTEEEKTKHLQKWAKIAQKWLKKGFTPEKVAETVWDRVGYLTGVKNGKVEICGNSICHVTISAITYTAK